MKRFINVILYIGNRWVIDLWIFVVNMSLMHLFDNLRPEQNGQYFIHLNFHLLFFNEIVEYHKCSLKHVSRGTDDNKCAADQVMADLASWQMCWPWLNHWGRMTHICVSKLTIIGSDIGLSPDRSQTIVWTNDVILLIGPRGTNFNEILIKILQFYFKKMRLKMSSAKRWPFCLGFNVLTPGEAYMRHNIVSLLDLEMICHRCYLKP